jgi:hypothetical protein
VPNEFGTPEAKDATAQHEKTVREAAEYAAGLDKAVKEDVLNRPLGSVKVSPEQRRQEYDLMRENPEHLAQFFTDQSATVEQMVQYAKEMEAKR